MIETTPETDTAAAVLAAARATRSAIDREEARLLALAVDWAAMHSVDSILEAEADQEGAASTLETVFQAGRAALLDSQEERPEAIGEDRWIIAGSGAGYHHVCPFPP